MTSPDPRIAPRIALVHAVMVAMDPVNEAFERGWPEAERLHLLDDRLGPDRDRDGVLTEAMSARIAALGEYAVAAGADGVLYTCSAFGPAIEAHARRAAVPVLKPNEAMFEQALGRGENIGMLATFGPSVASMEAEFADLAAAAGRRARLRTVLVDDALSALKGGDADRHNTLVAARAEALADCDVVLLAHFSTSRALDAVSAVIDAPVLTPPLAAVQSLRARIESACHER